MKFIAMSIQ